MIDLSKKITQDPFKTLVHDGYMPDEQYYPMVAVSNSRLGNLGTSPLEYWAGWHLKQEETDALRFGKLVHCYLLEPELFAAKYYLVDESERPDKTKTMAATVNKEWLEGLHHENQMQGKQPYSTDDLAKVKGMQDAAYRDPSCWQWLEMEGAVEHAHVWEQLVEYYSPRKKKMQQAAVLMKLKSDKLFRDEGIVFDVKTCNDASPSAWARHSWEYGYHRQGALYCDNLGADRFIILAIEKKAPYNCAVYEYDKTLLDAGRNYETTGPSPGWGYRKLLERLAVLRERYGLEWECQDPWPSYSYWAEYGSSGMFRCEKPFWV